MFLKRYLHQVNYYLSQVICRKSYLHQVVAKNYFSQCTDGSLINGKAEAGIYWEQNNVNIPISIGRDSSIFQAET